MTTEKQHDTEEQKFLRDLARLLNFYGKDTYAATTDDLLAEYLNACLENVAMLIDGRDDWETADRRMDDDG